MNERREDRALPLLTLMITLITLIITLCITDTTSHNFHGIVLPPGHWWLSISLVSPICDHPLGWSDITQPESLITMSLSEENDSGPTMTRTA